MRARCGPRSRRSTAVRSCTFGSATPGSQHLAHGSRSRVDCRRSADETLARLLSRASQGDEAAFERFYDATSSTVFGMALAVVGDRAHAVDIAEAVFVSAWKAASTLPAQGVELRAWLAALAHRELMSRIVQRAPEKP